MHSPVSRSNRASRRGAAGMQYATVIGLIAVVAIVAISALGQNVAQLLGRVSVSLGTLNTTGAQAAVLC